MEAKQRLFFEFLQFCIGNSKDIPKSLKDADWAEMYDFANKQALTGVLFHGIRQLPKELAPLGNLLMQWVGMAQRIRQENVRLFLDSAKVYQKFRQAGFCTCILKGQGNALLYPDPYMRIPGDIDIYIKGGRKRIMEYVDGVSPHQVMRYHHVDFPVMKTPVEVHFMPSYMFCPWYNHRMQKWFGKVMGPQCLNVVVLPDGYGEITVPTDSFNIVFILSHLYRHLFTEGIGLRQLLDYYYVVNKWYSTHVGSVVQNRKAKQTNLHLEELQRDLKWLGLWKFAGAVMFVLHKAFGLTVDRMIVPMDEAEGQFLLDEIMQGGNFGLYDDRLGDKTGEGKVHRYFRMSLRNIRFVKHYPSEALCEPLFRTYFWAWKKMHRRN